MYKESWRETWNNLGCLRVFIILFLIFVLFFCTTLFLNRESIVVSSGKSLSDCIDYTFFKNQEFQIINFSNEFVWAKRGNRVHGEIHIWGNLSEEEYKIITEEALDGKSISTEMSRSVEPVPQWVLDNSTEEYKKKFDVSGFYVSEEVNRISFSPGIINYYMTIEPESKKFYLTVTLPNRRI